MLLRLRKSTDPSYRTPLFKLAEELGYALRFLDSGRSLAELERQAGTGAAAHRSQFEDLTCVAAVLESDEARELTQPLAPGQESEVRIGEARFGAGSLALIAGPCAVENEEDLLSIARAVKSSGATVLRGGAFKPRTSPYSFQGLGAEGLEMLRRVGDEVGLAIVTEVLDPRDVELVASMSDAIQIGSRSMSNQALLKTVGQSGLPILLKRGLAATVREFTLAAEYVLAEGNPNVIMCERGIRSFDNTTRNLLDLGCVAHLKGATHLPVIVDPSHAAGRADLVAPLAKAGIVCGADGLIIEVHHAPGGVHSDGAQALSPAAFDAIAKSVASLAALEGKTLILPRSESAKKSPEEQNA
jgi:3-deoxy-7-phosphoheptulonate synthase